MSTPTTCSPAATSDRSLPLDFWPPSAAESEHARALIGNLHLEVVQRLLRASIRCRDTARLRAAVAACLERDPDALVAFAARWDVAFGLSRLADVEDATLARRLLLAMRLSDDERVRRPVSHVRIELAGRNDLTLGFVSLGGELRPTRGDRIVRLRRRTHAIEIQTAAGARHRVAVPLRPGPQPSGLSFAPYDTVRGWRVPTFEADDFALPSGLLHGHTPTTGRPGPRTRKALLPASLAYAYDVLSAVWPDTASWLRLLVPAMLRVRQSSASAARLSGSFGPGYPIYLSETTQPYLHAEDVVHELQHLRFQIWRATSGWPPPAPAGDRFVSPFRPDLRPLIGVHLGLHAFMTVNDLRLHPSGPLPFTAAAVADTAVMHQRNLFAFQSVSAHEARSPQGDRYLEAVAARLASQHDAITQLATRTVRLRAERALARHIRHAAAAGAALNAGLEARWSPPASLTGPRGGRT